jgi:hypothetical protein
MRRGPAKQEEPDALDGETVAGATGELANMRRSALDLLFLHTERACF